MGPQPGPRASGYALKGFYAVRREPEPIGHAVDLTGTYLWSWSAVCDRVRGGPGGGRESEPFFGPILRECAKRLSDTVLKP